MQEVSPSTPIWEFYSYTQKALQFHGMCWPLSILFCLSFAALTPLLLILACFLWHPIYVHLWLLGFWSATYLASDKWWMNSLWTFHALFWVFSLTLCKWMQVYNEIPFLSISAFRSLKNLSGKCKFYEYHSCKASVPVGALRFEVLGSKENTESSLSTKYWFFNGIN